MTVRLHLILDSSDTAVVDAIKRIGDIEIAQWDYSFDTAFEWTLHNESEKVDIFFASEYAQVSITDSSNKQIPRDTALLRRVKDLHLMRPQAKFILLCDEDRDLPENRHFLANLVAMGIYDFRTSTNLTEKALGEMIKEPKRDITHVRNYLPENVQGGTIKPFTAKETTIIKKKEKEVKAIDIFTMINNFRKKGDSEERKKPKVKHIIEKVRPSVVSFLPVGTADGNASLLAMHFAIKLADKEAKVALTEFHNSGIPRLGYATGIKSRVKTVEMAMQRIEDEEDVLGLYITPEEAAKNIPGYDAAIQSKIKSYPKTLHVLGGRDNIMPNIHPFKNIKSSTLDITPGEIVNQLIFRHNFDCAVFDLNGGLNLKLVFHSLKVSNYIFCIVDQHPAHISWLRQNLTIMEKAGIPLKNVRIILFPYYELPNIRLMDIEAALDTEIDYVLPDVTKELLNLSWGTGKIASEDFNNTIAEMILESTGFKLAELEKKAKRRITLPEIKLFSKKVQKSEGSKYDGQPS